MGIVKKIRRGFYRQLITSIHSPEIAGRSSRKSTNHRITSNAHEDAAVASATTADGFAIGYYRLKDELAETLRPGDEAEFVRLHKARVRGDDADAEAVGAAFGRGHTALINVISVAVGLAALI
jgi:hypothetical protein